MERKSLNRSAKVISGLPNLIPGDWREIKASSRRNQNHPKFHSHTALHVLASNQSPEEVTRAQVTLKV